MNVRYYVVFNDGFVSSPFQVKETALRFVRTMQKVRGPFSDLRPAFLVTAREKPKPFEPYYFLEMEYRL